MCLRSRICQLRNTAQLRTFEIFIFGQNIEYYLDCQNQVAVCRAIIFISIKWVEIASSQGVATALFPPEISEKRQKEGKSWCEKAR